MSLRHTLGYLTGAVCLSLGYQIYDSKKEQKYTANCLAWKPTTSTGLDFSQKPLPEVLSRLTTYPTYTFTSPNSPNGEGFIVVYNPTTRSPMYVVERLVSVRQPVKGAGKDILEFVEISENNSKARPPFFVESRLAGPAALFSTNPKDYTNSNHDRGHLVPAADFAHQDDLYKATFSMANIAPQAPTLNRELWAQMENWIRNYLLQHVFEELLVLTGPVYAPTFSEGGWVYNTRAVGTFPRLMPVPTHFYKVIVGRRRRGHNDDHCVIGAFMVPNLNTVKKSEPMSNFLIKLEDLEMLVGYRFLPHDLKPEDRAVIDSVVPDSRELSTILNGRDLISAKTGRAVTRGEIGDLNNSTTASMRGEITRPVINSKNSNPRASPIHLCACPKIDCTSPLREVKFKSSSA